MDLDEQRLLNALSTDRYTPRRELRHITGIPDRRLRTVKKHLLRNHDVVVVSSSAADGGYKLANSDEDFELALAERMSRVRDYLHDVNCIKRAWMKHKGQLSLEEIA